MYGGNGKEAGSQMVAARKMEYCFAYPQNKRKRYKRESEKS